MSISIVVCVGCIGFNGGSWSYSWVKITYKVLLKKKLADTFAKTEKCFEKEYSVETLTEAPKIMFLITSLPLTFNPKLSL